jgi:hypothetical protein
MFSVMPTFASSAETAWARVSKPPMLAVMTLLYET